MAKNQPVPMTRSAARRITSATAKTNGGKVPAGSFPSRADATVQRVAAPQRAAKLRKG